MNILICTSSREEIDKEYLLLAENIGKELTKLNLNLIFGAASTGMMGKIEKHFKNINSYTVEKYTNDLKNIHSSKEYIIETTMDRTKEMYKEADVILLLPGGTGTIAEFFSILEENRSINNPKPFLIFNYNGYYNKIFEIIDTCIKNNFNDKEIYNYFEVCNNFEEILKKIKVLNS